MRSPNEPAKQSLHKGFCNIPQLWLHEAVTPHPAEDEKWMRLALEQARQGVGLTSPNPPVGAVIVKEGRVLGQGWHHKAGLPHAEVEALRDASAKGEDVRTATAYVTLEPCSTTGRTGPCTGALIEAGISRVVYAATDPNPHHAGAADKVLAAQNIAVTNGILRREAEVLIRPFAKWIQTGLPYVIAKAGQSLDGRITRPPHEPQWLTNEAARQDAMTLRVRSDAILIGGETLRHDNPKLTLRGPNIPACKVQPWRVIVTNSGHFPPESHVFTDEHRDRTKVLQGPLTFPEILQQLAELQVTTVLVEGGGQLLGQAFAARAVDEVCWYIAPRICGGGIISVGGPVFPPQSRSAPLVDVTHQSIGDNIRIHGYPVWTDDDRTSA